MAGWNQDRSGCQVKPTATPPSYQHHGTISRRPHGYIDQRTPSDQVAFCETAAGGHGAVDRHTPGARDHAEDSCQLPLNCRRGIAIGEDLPPP